MLEMMWAENDANSKLYWSNTRKMEHNMDTFFIKVYWEKMTPSESSWSSGSHKIMKKKNRNYQAFGKILKRFPFSTANMVGACTCTVLLLKILRSSNAITAQNWVPKKWILNWIFCESSRRIQSSLFQAQKSSFSCPLVTVRIFWM